MIGERQDGCHTGRPPRVSDHSITTVRSPTEVFHQHDANVSRALVPHRLVHSEVTAVLS
jgi:hypothetical protein